MNPRLSACLGAAAALALASCSSSGPSAAQVVNATQAALENAASVSFVDVSHSGAGAVTLTGSLSATQAQEVSTTSAGIQLELRLVGQTIYVGSATAAWISSELSVPAAGAALAAGHWISIPSSDPRFAPLEATLSIPAAVSVYLPAASKASLGATRVIAGRSVTPIASRVLGAKGAHQDTTLFVASSSSLPVAGDITVVANGVTATKQAVFRSWNEPVTVTAPSDALAIASLG